MIYSITALVVIVLSILFEKYIYTQTIKGSISPLKAEKLVRTVDLITAVSTIILIALAIFTA